MIIEKSESIIKNIGKVIVGKEEVVRKVLMAVYAKGNILLEDNPGVGKTTLALAFAKTLGLDFKRVQFTPDTMPSDIIGFTVYNKTTGEFDYKQGAIFCNLFMGDEINRTSAKTQSALLEAMEENCVTIDGVTHRLPSPFICIATQNPSGSLGTQPLPESQLDRFMVKLSIGYPDSDEQVEILRRHHESDPIDSLTCITDRDSIVEIQNYLGSVKVSEEILKYMVALCEATRNNPLIELGVSPRGLIALSRMVRACAILSERDYVIPSDVADVFADVCAHRLILRPRAKLEGLTSRAILADILKNTPVPSMGK
ncbi:MAG: MoxR family ATPase [Corallococcus sp.]|nr:MoxR family ATPase [Bacillota bacterium]MCM1533176.1 MoxR family ATPase [Corallococcus sp.]